MQMQLHGIIDYLYQSTVSIIYLIPSGSSFEKVRFFILFFFCHFATFLFFFLFTIYKYTVSFAVVNTLLLLFFLLIPLLIIIEGHSLFKKVVAKLLTTMKFSSHLYIILIILFIMMYEITFIALHITMAFSAWGSESYLLQETGMT